MAVVNRSVAHDNEEPSPDDVIGIGDTYADRMRAAERGRDFRTGASTGYGVVGAPKSDAAAAIAKTKGLVAKLSAKPGVAHLIRAAKRFSDRLGNQFGAAITYFSFLSIVPILMVSFAVAAFVLQDNPTVLDELKTKANEQIPGGLMTGIIDSAIASGLSIGIVGLVLALYSGVGWMGNVRAAVQAQWRVEWSKTATEQKQKVYVTYGKDLLTLVGLGIGMVVSLALTAIGGSAQALVLNLLGLSDISWLKPVFSIVPFVLAIGASALMFGWFFRMCAIEEYTPSRGTLVKGAIAAALGFEVLKVAMTILIPLMSGSATFAVFGSIITLLFFFNLVARLVLFVSAWIGTDEDVLEEDLPQIPGPTPVRKAELGVGRSAGLLGLGAAGGWLFGRRRTK